MKSFKFGGKDIHTLDISKQKELTISVGGKHFFYSFEQLAFLSPLALAHFLETTEPFQFQLPSGDQSHYLDCFEQLDSLLHHSENCSINAQNVSFFSILAEALDNTVLLEECESLHKNENKIFSFSSQQLNRLWMNAKSFLKNFTFIINNKPIQINFALFCCVSDIFFNIFPSEESLSFSVSDDVFKCFCSFAKIFDGIPFYWEKYNISTIISMFQTFRLHSLQQFIDKFIFIPNNVEESIQFLSLNGSSALENIFQHSISILVSNFASITQEQLNTIPTESFDEILRSVKPKFPNEDHLLNLILQLIEKDSNKKTLLKNVNFSAVSSHLIKELFTLINVDDLDLYLFEQLKTRLFCEMEEKSQLTNEIQFLSESNLKFFLSFIESIQIPSSNSSKVDLFPHRDLLDKFEHWIFVPDYFDFLSFELKTDPKKTIFIILDNSTDEIYQSHRKANKITKSILILCSLKIIGSRSFEDFHSLSTFTFQNSVTSLGNACFSCCSSLQSISLPNALTSLGQYCFSNCSSLRSISLLSSLKKLEKCCFFNCSNLSYLFLPKSIKTINTTSFECCDLLFENASRIEIEQGSNFTFEIIKKRCQASTPDGEDITP